MAGARLARDASTTGARRALLRLVVAAAATAGVACGLFPEQRASLELEAPKRGSAPNDPAAMRPAEGRLAARPDEPPSGSPKRGLQKVPIASRREILLYVPPGYRERDPAPLVVTLHGAGGGAQRAISDLLDLADEAGLILLSPSSQGRTWDVVLGSFGPDVTVIDRALDYVFARYAVDRRRIAAEGFSDGASYALSLGLTNGDLFSHVIAFSPGFAAPGTAHGRPRIFISHGVDDGVLPIAGTSRRVVPALERAGYDVEYVEFDGKHAVPPAIATQAVTWLLGTSPLRSP